MTDVVDLAERLGLFTEHWSPKVVARLNDYEVKVVKLQGEFTWHTHDDTDELFLVVDGQLTIQLRDGDVTLGAGQLYVVPRGVEHCPRAEGEVAALLIEPTGVVNTGDAGGPQTATYDDSLLSDRLQRATSGGVLHVGEEPRVTDPTKRGFTCHNCRGGRFVRRQLRLTMTFAGPDWSNDNSFGYVCRDCGYVHMFTSRP